MCFMNHDILLDCFKMHVLSLGSAFYFMYIQKAIIRLWRLFSRKSSVFNYIPWHKITSNSDPGSLF